MTTIRLLVVDGNTAAVRARLQAQLGYDTGRGYARVLGRIAAGIAVDVVAPADGPAELPAGVSLADYDGVTMTGSALNVYSGGDPVRRQVELARAVMAAGVPFFGSCWGMQVAVTAAGGEVRANPLGREFGIARRILLSDAGCRHPLFAGKPRVFEAPTVHRDIVVSLPADAAVLASNDFGIQSVAFRHGPGTFWGVQYHPEYDFAEIAAVTERYGQVLVDEGRFADTAALAAYAQELRTLHADPKNGPLLWKHGLGTAMQDDSLRLLELRNWLDRLVTTRAQARTASISASRLSGVSAGA